MNELKKLLTEMLGWFHTLCVKNNLRYYVAAGTMLGAARHQGFIPWDDDIDVLMPREDINKLIKIMSETPNGRYVLEGPETDAKDFYYPFHKIYDTHTTLIENTKYKIKRGIYLDIFPIDGMGNTMEEVEQHINGVRKYNSLLLCKIGGFRKGRKLYKNLAVALFRLLPLNPKKMLKKVVAQCEERNWDNYNLCGNAVGLYGIREIMPREIMGTPTLYKFENIEVYGAEKYDEYLTRLYGDWRKLPPEEKRVSRHDFVSLDLEKGFLE